MIGQTSFNYARKLDWKKWGLEFKFELSARIKAKLKRTFSKYFVFTTRPWYNLWVSYSALAPEHPIVKYIVENNLLPEKR